MNKMLPLLILFLGLIASAQNPGVEVKKVVKLMGSRFEITLVAQDEQTGWKHLQEAFQEIARIEKLISSWDAASETSKINTNAGIKPVPVCSELFDLIQRSLNISKLTDGAFDISYASMDNIWKYDGSVTEIPSEEVIQASVAKINYRNIVLSKEDRTVFLKEGGMRIAFGAIGKGYAADKVKKMLIAKGVKAGIVNAAGDLTTWGTKLDGTQWRVGITNPLNKNNTFSWIPLLNTSVATSGNYEKYIEIDGERYSHIIDPRTGYPTKGIRSVTIFAKQAELCDALATAVFIMGVEAGIHLIDQLKGIEGIVIDTKGSITKSKGIAFEVE